MTDCITRSTQAKIKYFFEGVSKYLVGLHSHTQKINLVSCIEFIRYPKHVQKDSREIFLWVGPGVWEVRIACHIANSGYLCQLQQRHIQTCKEHMSRNSMFCGVPNHADETRMKSLAWGLLIDRHGLFLMKTCVCGRPPQEVGAHRFLLHFISHFKQMGWGYVPTISSRWDEGEELIIRTTIPRCIDKKNLTMCRTQNEQPK